MVSISGPRTLPEVARIQASAQLPSSTSGVDTHISTGHVCTLICHQYLNPQGHRLRRLKRLVMSEESTKIYGHPPITSQGLDPGMFILNNPPRAVMSYILGPNWRSDLTVTTYTCKRQLHQRSYISIPFTSREQEPEICLRMRRCGALCKSRIWQWALQYDRSLNMEMKKQIMGWPEEGGLWVLRLPNALYEDWGVEEELDMLLCVANDANRRDIRKEHYLLQMRLSEQTEMEGFCEVLKEAGGIYFENVEDCPEVQRLGLSRLDQEPTIEHTTLWQEFQGSMTELYQTNGNAGV